MPTQIARVSTCLIVDAVGFTGDFARDHAVREETKVVCEDLAGDSQAEQ